MHSPCSPRKPKHVLSVCSIHHQPYRQVIIIISVLFSFWTQNTEKETAEIIYRLSSRMVIFPSGNRLCSAASAGHDVNNTQKAQISPAENSVCML